MLLLDTANKSGTIIAFHSNQSQVKKTGGEENGGGQVFEKSSDQAKILIVDDEVVVRAMCRYALEHSGYRVVEAASGQEALALLKQEHYPVILTDVVMPGMSGLTLLDKIRSSYPDTAVIIMTGSSTGSNEADILNRGAAGFLKKPFLDLSILTSLVKWVLNS